MTPLIGHDISDHVITIGVSRRSMGGMTSVILSYGRYIHGMRFIPSWNNGGKLKKAAYMAQAVARLTALLACDRRIDIVHIHAAANASFERATIFIRLAKRFGKRVILHEHAADFVEYYNSAQNKQAITDTINSCDKMIVLSERWRDYFTSIGVRPDLITQLNNIVSPATMASVQRNTSSQLNLLYLGEVSRRKGCLDLLQALADHHNDFVGRLHLSIGGNIVDVDMHDFINRHNLSDIVSYEGWVSGDKKAQLLADADIYILPSYNEGLPIAILEALAHSHPVISTPVGGIPEIITDGVNGTLVNAGDTDAIASAIKRYLDNRELIASQGREALRSVGPYLPETVMKSLTDIYRSLLNQHR